MVRSIFDRANGSGCCFDDVPYTDGTFCSGDEPHFFCLNCSGKYAKEEIAKSKYSPFLSTPGNNRFAFCCFDGSGCKAPFSDQEIRRFLDEKTQENYEKLKTHHEIQQV
jgi:E3 ubiquitin-protein ligase RNF216